ncbi:MAG: Sjogren's syndrome/scleroderma autoantigen 1 family protein [Sulfolobaceae archaeon]
MTTTDSVKKAADLLRQGATMLDMACPLCHMPLFRLKNGDIVCPTHGKVYVVENEEEEKKITGAITLDKLENTLYKGIEFLDQRLNKDPLDIDTINQVIRYLEVIERINRIKGLINKNK